MKRRFAVIVVLAVTLNGGCASVSPTRSFPDLPKYLSNGDVLRLRETNGQATNGTLIDLSPASLTILTRDARLEVPENRVSRIQKRHTQRGFGALLGLGVGFAVGVAAGRAAGKGDCAICEAEGAGINTLVAMGVGAGLGAIVGTIIKAHKTVYEAPRSGSPGPPPRIQP
jgi:hypothetical protein